MSADQETVVTPTEIVEGPELEELTVKAMGAVLCVLDLLATDPDARRVIHPGSLAFVKLCAAEADMLGRPAAEILAERTAQRPEGPRRYLSLAEWHALKAREIEQEGVLGSHWPGEEARHVSAR